MGVAQTGRQFENRAKLRVRPSKHETSDRCTVAGFSGTVVTPDHRAHRHRVGTNYQQLPVNKPRCPVMHYQCDGAMVTAADYETMTANYHPNTREGKPQPDEAYLDPAWDLGKSIVDRYDSMVDHDDFTQAGDLFRLLDADAQDRMTSRIAGVLGQAKREIQLLQICHFYRADTRYGELIATKMSVDRQQLLDSSKHSHSAG